ncbi:MAG: toll/interleukin-1 receptor domain-containing protein [Thiolinea sp.]
MSRPKKVFISHSTKTDENLVFLNAVCDALDNDFDVLVDRRTLKPSDQWHACILEWMYECDAVVILMSRRALEESHWVLAEATVTSVRRRNEADFKLIVVPLDDVNEQQIQDHPVFGGVAGLQDFQFAPTCDCKNSTINAISDALKDLQVSTSPFESFTVLIRQTLKNIDDEALEEAIKRVTCAQLPTMTRGRCRADVLARAVFRGSATPLANLRELLEKLAHLVDHKQALTLLEMLKGIWVNAEAAAKLAEARENNITVSVNSVELEDFTGACYARNAWPYPKQIYTVAAGNHRTLPAIKQTLIESVAKSVVNPRRAERRLQQVKDPILLMFPPPELHSGDSDVFPDEDLLEQIKRDHPNVTIMLAAGTEEENQQKLQHFAQPLTPPLRDGEENEQYDRYEDVIAYIDEQIRLERHD